MNNRENDKLANNKIKMSNQNSNRINSNEMNGSKTDSRVNSNKMNNNRMDGNRENSNKINNNRTNKEDINKEKINSQNMNNKNIKKKKIHNKRAEKKSALKNNWKSNGKNKENKKRNKKGNKKGTSSGKFENGNFEKEKFDLDSEIVIGMPQGKKSKIQKKKNLQKKAKKKKILTEQDIARRKKLFKLIRWTSFIIIIIAAIIFIILSPIFNIKHVEVKDNDLISFEKIVSLGGIELNNNMFKYRNSQIIKNIKRNAYIEDVKIIKKIPDTIEIRIQERKPSLMLLFGNSYVYLNNQGYILEISDKLLNLPIIEGYKTQESDIVEGERLCQEDLEKLNTVLKILEISESEEIRDKITAVDISDEDDYKIVMFAEEKNIHLGDCSSLEARMLWIKSILEKTKGIAGDIFINMNLNEERPYFREQV